jgi:hypothetical protein
MTRQWLPFTPSLQRRYLEAIRAPEAWAAGYDGSGVQILINDDGVDNTHPDLAKLDVANSCGVYAPCAKANGPNAGVIDSHGTNCAAIAAADSNSACGVGVAPGAGIASCVQSFSNCNPAASEDSLTHNYNVNDISSNSWGIDQCEYIEDGRRLSTDCPFECPSVSSDDCPCDACDGDDWASGDLDSDCEDAVVDYCTSYFNDDVTPCLELDHYFVKCGYGQLSSYGHDQLVDGTTNGRGGLGTVYVFSAGNEYTMGDDVNYEGYLNSRFTISVGAVHADLTHSDYSSSGAPVFISAPGGDGGNMAVAKPVGNGNTDNCGDAGQGTSFACPLISGVVALVLEANPNLTWRDVQGVLAATARTDHNDEDDETGQWTTNQAGVKHSYKYGLGLVDALAAVTAATTWTTLPAEITLVTATTSGAALLDFDGTEHWVESEAAEFGSSDFIIESVSVYVTIEHPRRGDLRIELERNGVTSLLTDDKLALGTRYTHHKFTTLRHWGEAADDGAFTLRVADRREGSGDDDDHEPFDDWKFDASNYADDDGDDDGVLVSWTLQLYGHDGDTSTAWTPQPTPRGGCDSVAVSGSTSQTSRHGTYLPDGRCEDYVEYKCSGCSSTQYLWYHSSGYWAIGSGGCGTDSIGMYIITAADLMDVSGDWTEWTSSGWSTDSNIAVECLLPTAPQPTYGPTTLMPVPEPTPRPTPSPSAAPGDPTVRPTLAPKPAPVPAPTPRPTLSPVPAPTPAPVPAPTPRPTFPLTPGPSPRPSPSPSARPTPKPTPRPTPQPTFAPSPRPTPMPSPRPTPVPTTARPSPRPTPAPSPVPTTPRPSPSPSPRPTPRPTPAPTPVPGDPTARCRAKTIIHDIDATSGAIYSLIDFHTGGTGLCADAQAYPPADAVADAKTDHLAAADAWADADAHD